MNQFQYEYDRYVWGKIIHDETPLDYKEYAAQLMVDRITKVKQSLDVPSEDEDFKTITDAICKVLIAKNKAYGNSALNELKIFNGKCKVGARLDDKIARILNSDELRKNDVADLLGYLILTCKEKGFMNFDDQID